MLPNMIQFHGSPIKRQSLYTRLVFEMKTRDVQPEKINERCRRENIPPVEQQLIATGVTTGRCSEYKLTPPPSLPSLKAKVSQRPTDERQKNKNPNKSW
jgi:hypothetical protein